MLSITSHKDNFFDPSLASNPQKGTFNNPLQKVGSLSRADPLFRICIVCPKKKEQEHNVLKVTLVSRDTKFSLVEF